MNKLLQVMAPGARIAIFRALQFGDMMCAIPALRALRHRRGNDRLSLIGLPWARDFAARFPHLVDDFCEFPGFPGLPESDVTPANAVSFLRSVQDERFDLVIQMHGSGIVSNPCITLFGARASAGFYLPGQFCPDHENFLPYPPHETEVDRLLSLLCHLGAEPVGTGLEFPVTEAEQREWQGLAARLGVAARFACIHAGARDPRRRWPAEDFACIADSLAERGLQVVFTGVEEEREIVDAVRARMSRPSLDLCGLTSTGVLACLLQRAGLLVTNDTGIRHLAAAAGTPAVVLVTFADPARWVTGPAQRVLVETTAVPNACHHTPELLTGHRCLGDACRAFECSAYPNERLLTPEYVLKEVDAVLS